MRRILVAALLGAAAACGPGPGGAATMVAAEGANNQAGPERPSAEAELAAWREDLVRRCAGAIRDLSGANPMVPAEGQCRCTADRLMAGKTPAELQAAERTDAHGDAFAAALQQCMMETTWPSGG
jgi:hypothetical protein